MYYFNMKMTNFLFTNTFAQLNNKCYGRVGIDLGIIFKEFNITKKLQQYGQKISTSYVSIYHFLIWITSLKIQFFLFKNVNHEKKDVQRISFGSKMKVRSKKFFNFSSHFPNN